MSGRTPKISGIYVILGPLGVYVGESDHCWKRGTLALAVALGLECGIIRETPTASRLERVRIEADVAKLFQDRGLPVVSRYLTYAWPAQYGPLQHPREPKHRRPPTRIEQDGDRTVIHTTPKRLTAILSVLGGETLAATGKMLGVTRERVRQYLKEAGLVSRMSLKWGQSTNHENTTFRARIAKRQERRQLYRKRGQQMVEVLRVFALEQHRAPTYGELAALIVGKAIPPSGAVARLAAWLGRYSHQRRRDYWRRVHAAYRLAGLRPRALGGAGHITEKSA